MVFKLWYWKCAIFQRCIRVGCGRPSIRNAEWEDEYCRFCLLASFTTPLHHWQVKLPWHHYLPQQPVCGAPLRPGLQGLGQRAGPGRNCLLKLTKMCLRGEGAGGDSQWIGSELDREQTSWCKREGSLFKRKGDKLCARDKKPKQSATQPEGVWFCVRFHWKLSSASQEYEVARKMKWNGLLSFFRQPEKIKFSWILCNQMRCICETCFYLVD